MPDWRTEAAELETRRREWLDCAIDRVGPAAVVTFGAGLALHDSGAWPEVGGWLAIAGAAITGVMMALAVWRLIGGRDG